MNNRMRGFTLQPGHPNEIAGGKRPMHTLHSYLVTVPGPELLPLAEKTGGAPHPAQLLAVGGTPGAHRQPQTNLQVLDHLLRERMDPQDALDAPRWARSERSTGVDVERRAPDALGESFRRAGVPTTGIEGWHGQMGRSYLALVEPNGVAVAADLRGEGSALVL
jgi:gamma-glutamyltranspeptidase/glutathione hydrolase